MRALYWDGRELTFNSAYRAPAAGPRSALIQVHLAGICSTDLQIFNGYMTTVFSLISRTVIGMTPPSGLFAANTAPTFKAF